MAKNIKIAIALLVTIALTSAGLPAQAATQADAIPGFTSFSNETCVREPIAQFTVPTGVTPTGYELHVESEGGIWNAQTTGLISSSTFNVQLASKTAAGNPWTNLRVRFVYGSGSASQKGPWAPVIPLDTSTFFLDSAFCAEQKRLASLPGEPLISQIVYENDSKISAIITRPTKATAVSSFTAEQSLDGVTWGAANASFTQVPGSTSAWALAITVLDTSKNISAIRVRANNSFGAGPWSQIPTGRSVGSSKVAVSRIYTSEGYALFTNPIALPGTSSSPQTFAPGCTFTSVELSELNAEAIEPGDSFSIETSLEEGPFKLNAANQIGGTVGVRTVAESTSGAEISQIALKVQLCTQDIQGFQPRYLKVKISRTTDQKSIEGKIKVLTNDLALGSSIENAKFYCGVGRYGQEGSGSFAQNLTIEQTSVQKSSSDSGVVRGTLFRSGLVAANQKFQISVKRGNSFVIISRGQTDSQGQFVFKVKQNKTSIGSKQYLYFFADESATGAGLLNEPFSRVEIPIEFRWTTKGLVYQKAATDWVPQHNANCISNLSTLSNAEDDERHPVAWYVAKKTYYGMKNKAKKAYVAPKVSSKPVVTGPRPVPSSGSSYSNSYDSESLSIGKKCYVRGYTTRTGKRVSGYYRSC